MSNREAVARYRAKNRTALNAKQRARRDIARRAERRYDAKNRAARRLKNKMWREANPEKVRAQWAAWAQKNPAANNARTARRRARKLALTPALTDAEHDRISAIYAAARALTELTGEPYHVDHIRPLSRGGLHHPDNLQVLTRSENSRKKDRYDPAN